jgi:HEAT repeat protein
LGAGGRLDDTRPLKQLLAAANEPLRVDAAAALCRLGDPSGGAALERLAQSNDRRVRLQVAAVMGRLGDPSFVPTLIRMLDDRQGIRRAALESLPEVVGRDVAARPGERTRHMGERIAAWKQWFRDRHGLAATPEGPLTK